MDQKEEINFDALPAGWFWHAMHDQLLTYISEPVHRWRQIKLQKVHEPDENAESIALRLKLYRPADLPASMFENRRSLGERRFRGAGMWKELYRLHAEQCDPDCTWVACRDSDVYGPRPATFGSIFGFARYYDRVEFRGYGYGEAITKDNNYGVDGPPTIVPVPDERSIDRRSFPVLEDNTKLPGSEPVEEAPRVTLPQVDEEAMDNDPA